MTQPSKVALITGGASGLGLEFARLLANDGYTLILVGRDEERLQKTRELIQKDFGVKVTVHPIDLGQVNSVAKLAAVLGKDQNTVDILINNAGVGLTGLFAELDGTKQREMLQLNVMALTELTRIILPGMLASKKGNILNIASTAAFQPGPLMAVYYASKAYVLSFSEALSEETRGTGVTVTALCPGPTKTGFQDRAQLSQSILFRRNLADPAVVARLGYQAMQRGDRVLVPGFGSWVGSWLVRFLPRSFVLRGVRRLHQS